jgi:hypothetical protein
MNEPSLLKEASPRKPKSRKEKDREKFQKWLEGWERNIKGEKPNE